MCGIAAAINWTGAQGAVEALTADLHHRGEITDPIVSPDERHAFCTRRLPITDADNGAQPKLSSDGRILVILNGEIYNYRLLRHELQNLGVKFDTDCDTEVLANALGVWGANAVYRLEGMYAFVALDLKNHVFLAARDPFGVKPLYVLQGHAGYLFCSEIRPLLNAHPVRNVMFVPPGHVLTADRLVDFTSRPIDQSGAGHHAHDPQALDRLMRQAIARRLPEGLPTAVMFSGGIDGTLVVHYARQSRPDLPAYFIGDPTGPDHAYALEYTQLTQLTQLDLRRAPLELDQNGSLDQIDELVGVCETFEPATIRAGICTLQLSRRMRRDGLRVALCGEGADELFAGYDFLEAAYAQSASTGALVRDQTLGLMHSTILQRLDRCGMRFGVELREPFLDQDVVDYALGLPSRDLVRITTKGAVGKSALRDLYDLAPDQLPASIRDRRKSPMNEGAGFNRDGQGAGPWRDLAEAHLTDKAFADGRRRFAAYDPTTKEELLYLERLSLNMDISRVPHLASRPFILMPR